MDRGAWWTPVHRVTKSQTQLSTWAHTHAFYSLAASVSTCSVVLSPSLCPHLQPDSALHSFFHSCLAYSKTLFQQFFPILSLVLRFFSFSAEIAPSAYKILLYSYFSHLKKTLLVILSSLPATNLVAPLATKSLKEWSLFTFFNFPFTFSPKHNSINTLATLDH